MKDLFSSHADDYARYRPVYPEAMYHLILSYVERRNLAWDAGTGNGQAAIVLADFFDQVIATDISEKQLKLAQQASNINYVKTASTLVPIADNSVDLVTVAQAIHWFDFEPFYKEVRRVAAPGAVLAAWCYGLSETSDAELNKWVNHLYHNTLDGYWQPERKYIDSGLVDMPFPFREIPSQNFEINTSWSREDFHGYLGTWSAVKKYIEMNETDPLNDMPQLDSQHSGKGKIIVRFPLSLRMGFV